MPGADRGVEEFLDGSVAGQGPTIGGGGGWRRDRCRGCHRRIDVGRHPLDALGGLRRDGSESESSDEDQFAHLKSPLLDERRLDNRFDPRCEAGHAESGVRKEWQ
jgi:hypothetical protein